MKLLPIKNISEDFPPELQFYIKGARLYDSSCSPVAKVVYSDKDGGYFIKSAAKGTLMREAAMTRYFCNMGLAARVLAYLTLERDWLVTEKINGEDCIAEKYLGQPERLCDMIAENLKMLHSLNFDGCPVQNHTQIYLAKAQRNFQAGKYDVNLFPDNWGYATATEAYDIVKTQGYRLKTDTLLHGDYCLPNIILNNWRFSGFVDLDNGGIGDKHVDIFWAIWTLNFNLKTDKFRRRFIDAYGHENIDDELLRIVAAAEVFL